MYFLILVDLHNGHESELPYGFPTYEEADRTGKIIMLTGKYKGYFITIH